MEPAPQTPLLGTQEPLVMALHWQSRHGTGAAVVVVVTQVP